MPASAHRPARPPPPTHADAGGPAAVLGAAVAVEPAALVAGQQRGAALAALPGAHQAAGAAVQHGGHPRGAAWRLGRAAPAAGPGTRRLPPAHLRGKAARTAGSRGRPGRRLPPHPPGAPHLPRRAGGGAGAAGRAGPARRPSPWSRPPPPRRASPLCRQSHCSRLYRGCWGPPPPAPPRGGQRGPEAGAGAGPGAPLPFLPPPVPASPSRCPGPAGRALCPEAVHGAGTGAPRAEPVGGGSCRAQPGPTVPIAPFACGRLPHELCCRL